MAIIDKPFEAYRGDEDYIFVSYAHLNSNQVYPDLELLRSGGFNVWYDEGISPGSRWTTELADAIEHCTLFIAFLSPAAVASENCSNEIEFAVSRRCPILVVHTEETEVPSGLELSLGGRQALLKYALPAETYSQRLQESASTLAQGGDPHIPRKSTRSAPHPMWLAVLGVVVAGAVYLTTLFDLPPQAELRLAIAVRPFDIGISGQSEDSRFFAAGIADDLVMRLGHWRTLPVIARSASFSPDVPTDPLAAGQVLNTRYLVEGNVVGTQDAIKLSVYLVDAVDGRNVWSKEYDYDIDEALRVQSNIADSIVTQINPALIAAESQRALRADPANLDAWSAAMRGWWHLNTESSEGLTEAQAWFARAAELDPTWSWPHSAQALASYRAVINGWSPDMRASVGVLIQSANKAVQLDSQDAFAHHALGHAYAVQGQVDQSLGALQRGVELSPNDPMANGCYAMQLAASARTEEALKVIDHATAISPEDPWQHRFALVRARAHFAAANYPISEQWALRSLQLRPTTGAFLHSVAAPALGDGLDRARSRTDDARMTRALPPLAGVENSFKQTTDASYVARLIDGLRQAGFE
jgi:TolB-like protein